MIIKRIEVKGFKKFSGSLVVEPTAGLCIIGGSNEQGKSTLFDALRSLFFQRHNASGEKIKAMLPYGADVKPEVAAEFELGGKSFCVRKTFSPRSGKGTARLESTGLVLEGTAVEEKLQELFLLNGGAGKKNDADTGVWEMLWLLQSTSIEGMKPGQKCKETVSAAVENELGKMLGGKAGDELLKRVKVKYDELWTGGGKHKSRPGGVPELEQKVRELSAKLAAAESELKSYDAKLDSLAKKEEMRARYRTQRSLENAQKEFDEAGQQKELLAQLETEVDLCDQKVRHGESAQKNLKARSERRAQLRETVARLAINLAEKIELLDKEKLAQAALSETVEQLGKTVQTARTDLEQTRTRLVAAERAQEFVKLSADLDGARQALKRADSIQEEIEASLKLRDAIIVTPQDVATLRNLEREAAQAKSRLDVASTRIRLRPQPGKKASFDGKEISDTELTLSAAGIIKLDDWGEIEVVPGGEDLSKRQALAADCDRKLSALLAKLKVATAEEAQELSDKRKALTLEADAASMQLNGLAPKGIAELRARIEKSSAALEAFADVDAKLTDPAAINTVRAEITRLEREERTQRDHVDKVRAEIASCTARIAKFEAELKSFEDQKILVEQNLEKDLTDCSDESLAKELELATDQLMVDQRKLDLVKTSLATKKPQAITDQWHSARAKKDRIAKEIAELDTDILVLNTELASLGQRGFEEERERLVQELESAQKDHRACELTSNAYRLLWEKLSCAKNEAREEFLLPLSRRLEPYLANVFPDTSLNIDRNELNILSLQRHGVEELFTDLSIGTREQIAVLTRLAMADLLHSRGMPALVILDDALVYSDQERFAAMKKALLRGASMYQVVILTCRPADYDDMGVPIIELAECAQSFCVSA